MELESGVCSSVCAAVSFLLEGCLKALIDQYILIRGTETSFWLANLLYLKFFLHLLFYYFYFIPFVFSVFFSFTVQTFIIGNNFTLLSGYDNSLEPRH